METFLKDLLSIISVQFMFMMVAIALILIFYDSRILKKKGATRDYKLAKSAGVCYLILGIGLYIAGKFMA